MEKIIKEQKPPEVAKEKKGQYLHKFKLIIDGKDIGHLETIFLSKPFPTYYLNQVFIKPLYRGKGFGSEILKYFNSLLKSKGRMGLLVNSIDTEDPKYQIYEKNGWKRFSSESDWFVYNKPDSVEEKDLAQVIYRINHIVLQN